MFQVARIEADSSNEKSNDSKRMGLQIDFHAGFDLTGKIAGTRFWSSSNIFLMTDGDVPDALKCTEYSFRLSGILTVTKTGRYKFGLPRKGKALSG
jgi:beta-glucosidase